jgi:ribosomal protein S6
MDEINNWFKKESKGASKEEIEKLVKIKETIIRQITIRS